MKIQFLATGNAPEYYSISSEVITAHKDGLSESFDLSPIETDGKFTGATVDTLPLAPAHVIRDAYRDELGELHVILCQQVGPGNWSESAEITDYDPDAVHVQYNGGGVGRAWAMTRNGKVWAA